MDFEVRLTWSKSLLQCLIAMCPWTIYLSSLSLNLHTREGCSASLLVPGKINMQ